MLLCLSFLLIWAPLAPIANGFAGSHSALPSARMTPRLNDDNIHSESTSTACEKSLLSNVNRRQAFQKTAAFIATTAISTLVHPNPATADIEGVVSIPQSSAPPESSASNVNGNSVTVFKTKSGLQYIDIVEGTGISPRYGNFVSISYKAYIKFPDIQGKPSKLDEFDSDGAYLIKHGNGRTVPGLDEGLHTMKVGGKRRIIIPPKLGYVTSGLGPIPPGPYGRWKLNRLLDRMIEVKGGNVIFDVEMRSVIEDEADQGYYEDESLSPEDFNTLRQNLERSQQAARGNA
ncbi:hypothetical protein HJC23_008812 [Cyclotella cryptica]|uniref:peptidylprolyl isomerase n=1 Tax=Cyclotella cryptica TaxID=29204 RepID=A0ABD3QAC5_9STRA|eukprot:CCRYP_007454-RA/>CCRYP_007454-RA protein AED:0.42 eAED:0.42 QI:0/-1/0/1/-1/1/1/0/288